MSNQLVDAQLLLQKAHLQKEMHVADFGCGRTGQMTYPAATIVGERGVVFAVDILKDVLDSIYKGAQHNRQVNVHTVWTDLEKYGMAAIPEKSLDVGFLVNTLVQTKDRIAVLNEVARLLKDKSRLVVVDWMRKEAGFGPEESHFVNFEDVKNWAVTQGFVIQEEFPAGPFHWGIVMYRT